MVIKVSASRWGAKTQKELFIEIVAMVGFLELNNVACVAGVQAIA
jgi:hypothetical protein